MRSLLGARVVVAVASALAACLLLVSLVTLARAPRMGVELAWDEGPKAWRVTAHAPWSPLREGDRLEAIDGFPVTFLELLTDNVYLESRTQALEWLRAKRDLYDRLQRPVEVTVSRGDDRVTVTVTPRPSGLAVLNRAECLHLLVGLAFFLVGAIVVLRGGLRGEARVFGALCAGMTLVYLTNATSLLAETVYAPGYFALMNALNMAFFFLAPATLLHFALLLPRRRTFLERRPGLVPAYYAVALAVLAFAPLSVTNAAVAVFFVGSLLAIGHAFLVYRGPVERQQMKWVAAGFGFGVAPWVLINGISLVVTGERLMNDTVPGSFFIAIPICLAFAIQKHRLLDIDALFQGTFVYVLTLAIVGVLDAGVLALFGTHFGESLALDPASHAAVRLVVAVSVYAPVRDAVRRVVRKVLRRGAPDPMRAMATLADRAAGKRPDDVLDELAALVRDLVGPERVTWLRPETDDVRALFAHLPSHRGALAVWEEPALRAFFEGQDIFVVLPIHRQDDVIAALCLGDLGARRFYRREHIELLGTLGREAELLVENARLFDDVVAQTRAGVLREAKYLAGREAMLRELHDGLSGIATGIAMLADAGRASPPEGASRTLATISELAREHVAEIRGFMQDLDLRPQNWRAVGQDLDALGRRILTGHGVALTFTSTVPPSAPVPDPLLDFHVRRIVKEACANVVKHAHAHKVDVHLVVEGEHLTLSITDDGQGLTTMESSGRGLVNMRRRAEALGGRFSIDSGPGRGTTLRVELPLSLPDSVREAFLAAAALPASPGTPASPGMPAATGPSFTTSSPVGPRAPVAAS